MVAYEDVLRIVSRAQYDIDEFASDATIIIQRHRYPFLVTLTLMSETHHFRIIRKRNLKRMIVILREYLLAP